MRRSYIAAATVAIVAYDRAVECARQPVAVASGGVTFIDSDDE